MKRFFATWWGKLIGLLIIVAVGLGAYYGVMAYTNRSAGNTQQTGQFAIATARKGNITVSVNGTGTMEPVNQEDVTIEGSGTIKKVYFKEGDAVKKGDLMYEIEDEDLPLNIKQAELNIKQLQLAADNIKKQISKATVTTPAAGLLSLNVSVGDQVSPNMILGTVQNISTLSLSVSIYGEQAISLKNGQSVTVTVDGVSGNFNGKVVQVTQDLPPAQKAQDDTDQSAAQATAVIDVTNSASKLRSGQTASAVIKTDAGDVTASGQLSAKSSPVQIKAPISGEIQTLYVSDGVIVSKGQKLLKFDTAALQNDLDMQNTKIEQAQLDLQDQKAQLDKLKVYAPADGIIIKQNVAEGDDISSMSQVSSPSSNGQQTSSMPNIASTVNSSSANVSSQSKGNVAATIADANKFQISMPVDELDINKIKIGQKAVITADALPDKSFEGEVSEVSDEGISQGGVTTFDITVVFNKTEDLKTGMTADVEVLTAQNDNIVIVPIEAVMDRNGQKFVIIYDETNAGTNGAVPEQNNMLEVKTGINNESYIEITEGLKEGQRVVLTSLASQSGNAPFGNMIRPDMPSGDTQRRGTSGQPGFMPQNFGR